MSIIGEPIGGEVATQIFVRQNLHGKQTRTNTDLSILNNTNAWLKLASSVRVLTEGKTQSLEIDATQKAGQKIDITSGEERLRNIGLDNTGKFTGNQLAKKAVLFNTLSELNTTTKTYNSRSGVSLSGNLWNNSSYGLGSTDFGIVPSPGLISAKINCLNRGSIREATVELKAYNLFQFELIELLYLRLGYSMLLEWGWDKFLNNKGVSQSMGNTLTEDLWFQDIPTDSYRDVIKKIAEYRTIYSNNYDGFLGKVVNFDWSFQPDGTYNIILKLITIGDVIESLKVNLPTELTVIANIKKSTNTSNTLQSELSKLDSPIVTNAGSSTLSLNLYKDISESTGTKWNQNQSKYFSWFLNLSEDDGFVLGEEEKGKEIQKRFPPTGTDSNKHTYFLTFEELLNKLNDLCVPSLNQKKVLLFDTGESNICSVFPNQISFNPKICLVKPAFTTNINISSIEEEKTIQNGVKNYYNSFAKLKNFVINEKGNISYGKIMNIYLNYDFISNTLQKNTGKDGEISIFKFLEEVCNNINSSLGGFNKLEPILVDDNIIKIIDQNPIPGIENSLEFGCLFSKTHTPFEIFGYSPSGSSTSNFVRDFGFKTKIGPELASMITIGATSENKSTKNYDGTAFSKWNDGLQDSYAIVYNDPKKEIIETPKFDPFNVAQRDEMYTRFVQSEDDKHYWYGGSRPSVTTGGLGLTEVKGTKNVVGCPITNKDYDEVTWEEYTIEAAGEYRKQNLEITRDNQKEEKLQEQIQNYLGWLLKAFGGNIGGGKKTSKLYFYLNDDFYKIGKELFKGFIIGLNNNIYNIKKNPSNTIGFIPADLSLTIDGLAGVKIYNALSINQRFLPKQYPKALKFIITKVNHNISNNNWDTGLHTISVPNVIPPNPEFFTTALTNLLENQISKLQIKPFEGPTPNADRLRDWLNLDSNPNYSEKEEIPGNGEISNGGDISKSMSDVAINIFTEIRSTYPNYTIRVTGGNDIHHQEKAKSSAHTKGDGLDFTISPAGSQEIANISALLKSKFFFINRTNTFYDGGFINEYTSPSNGATGNHFHIYI